jgi:hypothetical protein
MYYYWRGCVGSLMNDSASGGRVSWNGEGLRLLPQPT